MIRKLMLPFVVTGLLAVTACNTVKGVGEDVQSVGQAGEDAIN